MTESLTGYPSIDKPWLKYYSEEAKNPKFPECSIYEFLYERNKEHPSDYALNYFGKKITYRELFSMIDEVAKAFNAIGVKPGEVVSIVTVSTVTSVVCFYALNKIGAVSNFLNVLSEEKDLINYFKEAKSKVVVTLDLFAEKVVSAANQSEVENVIAYSIDENMPLLTKVGYKLKVRNEKISIDNSVILWANFLKMAENQPQIKYKKNPKKLALLAHTGGTTGIPKAVMLNDMSINSATQTYVYMMSNAKQKDVFLHVMVPFVAYGLISCTHVPLCLRFCCTLIPKFESRDINKYIKKYSVNHIMAVPSYLMELKSGISLSKIKNIAVGGDGLNGELENNINDILNECNSKAVLTKGYAMTEACATAVASFKHVNKTESVGIPLPGNNIMIYDRESRKELPYGEVGEICLQCKSRMIGYLDNEEETKNLFWIHKDGSEWLHTGDLGYVDEDGFVFLIGRMKRIILTTGGGVAYKVFPNTVEEVLIKHQDVVNCCVVGATEGENQVLKAVVVSEQNEKEDVEYSLRKLCKEELPSHARPTFYEFVEELPLTAAGKVDYKLLEG
ncbi:MAG: acyl--CoA ligase [Eubacterium sp.]|nr:acyl--CoA ligase [Eubacterium sp.]